jgi:hypothetical protein
MIWRERVQKEVHKIIEDWWPDRDVTGGDLADLAQMIAENLPSPDQRNGFVIVPVTPTEGMLEELARIGDGPMISGAEVWGYMLAAATADVDGQSG